MQQVGRLGSVLSISAKSSWMGLLHSLESKMFVFRTTEEPKEHKEIFTKA